MASMDTIRRELRSGGIASDALEKMASLIKPGNWPWIFEMISKSPFQKGEELLHQSLSYDFAKQADASAIRQLTGAYLKTSDEAGREQLGDLLREIRRPELVPELQNILSNPAVYSGDSYPIVESSAAALAGIGTPAVVEDLIGRLSNAQGLAATALNKGMTNLRSDASIPLLTKILENQHSLSSNHTAKMAAIGLLGQIPSEYSVQILSQKTKNNDPELATWAEDSLQKLSRATGGKLGSTPTP